MVDSEEEKLFLSETKTPGSKECGHGNWLQHERRRAIKYRSLVERVDSAANKAGSRARHPRGFVPRSRCPNLQ